MSKLPENCPVCGAKMELGYLNTGAGGSLGAGLAWWVKGDGMKMERLNDGLFTASLRGARCKNCQILLVGYSQDMKNVKVDKENWLDYEKDSEGGKVAQK